MSFEEEWGQARNRATDLHADMQLNTASPHNGGGSGGQGGEDFASSPAEKKKAARAIDEHLLRDTQKAGDVADEDTANAVKAFKPKDGDGWLTSPALHKAQKAWSTQVKSLKKRLAAESSALRDTSISFNSNELGIRSQILRESDISKIT
ncbi:MULTISPECIES: hypothetical protein [unclassified Streptomyces]|uniref:hypothetical protein n=1 Tax=unclassified Streptomyces TaxID=2593676 RepID=UPI002286C7E9|nr:hypothetical protein [Streptomyces sp. Je 1-369]WAL98216.1 hypothetical protein NOO62_29255 [Streptomyces sp. Je 1-369]